MEKMRCDTWGEEWVCESCLAECALAAATRECVLDNNVDRSTVARHRSKHQRRRTTPLPLDDAALGAELEQQRKTR